MMIDWTERWAANSETQQVKDGSSGDSWQQRTSERVSLKKNDKRDRMEIKTYLIWYIHYSYF